SCSAPVSTAPVSRHPHTMLYVGPNGPSSSPLSNRHRKSWLKESGMMPVCTVMVTSSSAQGDAGALDGGGQLAPGQGGGHQLDVVGHVPVAADHRHQRAQH